MKKVNSKKALLMAIITLLGFLSSALTVASTYAIDAIGVGGNSNPDSYYSRHLDDAFALQNVQMYYDASVRCLGGYANSKTIDLTNRDSANDNDFLEYYELKGDKLFADTALYSAILANVSGSDGGKIQCSQLDVLPTLLNILEINDDEHKKDLLCNGSQPGIFKIEAGYGLENGAAPGKDGGSDAVWPKTASGNVDLIPSSGKDCGKNLDLLLDYTKNRTMESIVAGRYGTPFSIRVQISENAASYFQSYIKNDLGSKGQLDSSVNKRMDYWTYYRTFEAGCATINNGETTSPGSSTGSLIGMYDAETGRMYYHTLDDINPNKKLYYTVVDNSQMYCRDLATQLADTDLIKNVNIDRIKGCYDAYNEAREKWDEYGKKYKAVSDAGKKYVEIVERTLTGIKTGGKVYTTNDFTSGESIVDQLQNQLDSSLSELSNGIDVVRVFDNSLFSSLYNKVKRILSNTEIDSSGKVLSKSVSDEEIAEAEADLRNVESASNDVSENLKKINNILARYPAKEYPGARVWDMGSDGVVSCPGETELIEKFNELNLPNSPTSGTSFSLDDYIDTDPESGAMGLDGVCYNAGVEGMAWILCPTMNNMAKTTDMFTGIIDNLLSIDPMLYSDSNDGGVKVAWGYFRDIANVFMIVILLVIIVSQLTGYGIDNYGIKKMLPKLVMMAVAINFSYYICAIAIDASNIVGSALNDLFRGIGDSISDGAGAEGVISGIISSIFAAAGVAGSVGGTIITVATLTMGSVGMGGVVIAIILALIPAILAVLMFFLTLGARNIVILVFAAISPMAFACYILPNTQNLFKKWWNIFRVALLVYPICGGLYGASFVVRGIIFQNGNGVHFAMALVAIVAPFLPFLLLPTLLRDVLGALGKLGGTLSTLGSGLRSGLMSGANTLQNTEAYKSMTEAARRNMNFRAAGLRRNGNTWEDNRKNLGRFGRFIRGGDIGMNAARRRAISDLAAIESEKDGNENWFKAAEAGARSDAEARAVKNEEAMIMNDATMRDNVGGLQAKLTEAIVNDDKNKIRAYQNVLSRKKEAGREAVREAMHQAQSTAQSSGTSLKREAVQTYASNLINNWGGDYKDNNRSTYDYANKVLDTAQRDTLPLLDVNASPSLGSLKTSQIANMDKEEFGRLKSAIDASGDQDVKAKFADLCYDTLHDPNALTNIKLERQAELEDIANQSEKSIEQKRQQVAQQQVAQQSQRMQEQMAQGIQELNNALSHNSRSEEYARKRDEYAKRRQRDAANAAAIEEETRRNEEIFDSQRNS